MDMFHNPIDVSVCNNFHGFAHAHNKELPGAHSEAHAIYMMVPMIQVTNVSPQATQQQMKELLSYLGDIERIKIYPDE